MSLAHITSHENEDEHLHVCPPCIHQDLESHRIYKLDLDTKQLLHIAGNGNETNRESQNGLLGSISDPIAYTMTDDFNTLYAAVSGLLNLLQCMKDVGRYHQAMDVLQVAPICTGKRFQSNMIKQQSHSARCISFVCAQLNLLLLQLHVLILN